MTNTTATQADTKVVLAPVIHEGAGGRVTRVTFRAYLAPRSYDTNGPDPVPGDGCAHEHGHRTTEAAAACGTAMWKKLPR